VKYSKIIATGSALPPKATSNSELAQKIALYGSETSDEWIVERTGIRQRYLAEDPELTTTELATRAAREALRGLDPDSVGLIIVATTTPDRLFPSTACQVQAALGCKSAAAFDLQAVCSGFVYALTVADAYIKSGAARRVLVIGSETLSRILDWRDRSTCVLFGDGAGAVVLEASGEPGILASEIGADGTLGTDVLAVDARIEQGKIVGDPFIRMDGKAVFRTAVTTLTDSAHRVLEKAGAAAADLDLYIPHQANLRIMSMVTKHLGLPPEKMMVSVDSHGNTSAASVPLSLDKAFKSGRISSGSLVLLQGVGGGFTWGSVLVRF
jgi:3-oxoacyl-[acyl-carrier-protein] synthase-3